LPNIRISSRKCHWSIHRVRPLHDRPLLRTLQACAGPFLRTGTPDEGIESRLEHGERPGRFMGGKSPQGGWPSPCCGACLVE
jgi:hypothetical protein